MACLFHGSPSAAVLEAMPALGVHQQTLQRALAFGYSWREDDIFLRRADPTTKKPKVSMKEVLTAQQHEQQRSNKNDHTLVWCVGESHRGGNGVGTAGQVWEPAVHPVLRPQRNPEKSVRQGVSGHPGEGRGTFSFSIRPSPLVQSFLPSDLCSVKVPLLRVRDPSSVQLV